MGDDASRSPKLRRPARFKNCSTKERSSAKRPTERRLRRYVNGVGSIAGANRGARWGFIPSTKGEDDDPIDVRNIARPCPVPRDSHREKSQGDARDLPKQVREEIEKFFVATDELEDKELKFLGWKGPKAGKRLVDQVAKQFKKRNGKN